MNLIFTKQNPPISSEVVARFEQLENITLPEDYKQFLLETNGGSIDYGELHFTDTTGPTSLLLTELYGLSEDLVSALWLRKALREGYDFPDELLAIGQDMGSHLKIALTVRGDIGRVYVWLETLPDYKFAVLVANNFRDFLAHIKFDHQD